MTHTKQLLLVTFFCTNAGIGISFWTDSQTANERRMDGGQTADRRTDRRGSQNSYLDECRGILRGEKIC